MAITSNYPDIQLREADIFSLLFDRPDRPFAANKVIFQDATHPSRTYTYEQVRNDALWFGKGLQTCFDIKKGDVIGLFTPNDIDVPAILFGSLWTGAVISAANPGYKVDELAHQLKDSAARFVVSHVSSFPTAREACSLVGIPESQIILVGNERSARGPSRHWTVIREAGQTSAGSQPPTQIKIQPREDLAFLAYSSGTTGKPKAVMLTHFNVTANIEQIRDLEPVSHDNSVSIPGIPDAPQTGDKVLACLPFFHIYGLTCLLINPLFKGVHCVMMEAFDFERWCQVVETHQVTVGYIVPPIVLLLAKHPAVNKYNLSSLRVCSSGAAPLTRELVEAVYKRTGIRTKQGYGLTETSPTLFAMRWQDWHRKVGTTGLLVPNMTAKFCIPSAEIDHAQGAVELPRGEVGELWVSGPNVFRGYLNRPEATAECLVDGWFKTGDVGFMDDEGHLTITDRAKELIKYKGFQVAPAELEGLLVDCELVDDAAVIGVFLREQSTEVPRAYVVRKGGPSAVKPGDDQSIIRWMDRRVTNHKKLRGGVRFVESIPKSPSGKILRRILKDEIKKEQEREQEIRLRGHNAKL
ncbi:uncharacterized protein Z518_04610 [Rhinocladiella mackenziei CBS 650.93]|uniref:Phenylacetyl-CoA ligase n=1 Tax=Rhinocladiella mackenziei CBS 650.93 TaxID=1442369 RepID=A0A0D2ILL4_9EURO|nr:uncharacterized protein Z518_04610 [Rhinocladiella mackenziei CBS 650.93]KIX06634.1 hypothetical protein Z518_04610 [Rhinocladiella mackenziei CBS 650.93]